MYTQRYQDTTETRVRHERRPRDWGSPGYTTPVGRSTQGPTGTPTVFPPSRLSTHLGRRRYLPTGGGSHEEGRPEALQTRGETVRHVSFGPTPVTAPKGDGDGAGVTEPGHGLPCRRGPGTTDGPGPLDFYPPPNLRRTLVGP